MACMNADRRVPDSVEERMDELAEILARGVLRMGTKKIVSDRENRLDVSSGTRLNVTAMKRPNESEVT